MRKICPSFIIFLPFLLPIFFPWTSLGGFLHEFLSLLGLVLGTQQFISIKWFAFIAIHVWSYYHRLFFHFVPLLRPKSKNEVALFSFILTFINAFVYVRWRWNKKTRACSSLMLCPNFLLFLWLGTFSSKNNDILTKFTSS